MDSRNCLTASVVVIISIMMTVSGYMMVTLLDGMAGGNPLFHEDKYSVSGTYQGNYVEGLGESRCMSENDNCIIYEFNLSLNNNESESSVRAVLLCDGQGVPSEDFELLSHNPDGTDTWRYVENEVYYEYCIGANATVKTLSITSGNMSLLADIVN